MKEPNSVWRETIVYAQDTAPGGAEGPPPSPFGGMLYIMIPIFAIMYFLLIRPNQKRERERRQMLESLAKGMSVTTTGGMCGTIIGLHDKTVVLKVSDDPVTKIEFVRGAISQVASDTEANTDAEKR